MKGQRTFTIIKPHAVQEGNLGAILHRITDAGFKIVALKMDRLDHERAESFYSVHQGRDFFERLVTMMISGPIVVAVLEKNNAVEDFRTLLGKTNPEEAAEGTLRKLFATNQTLNAVHGSDSDENALIESEFFFSAKESFSY